MSVPFTNTFPSLSPAVIEPLLRKLVTPTPLSEASVTVPESPLKRNEPALTTAPRLMFDVPEMVANP